MTQHMIVFDMDGVLAEVSESYRESIVRTVRHFTGCEVSRERIQDYKNQGGWNNDWVLAQRLCQDLGVEVAYAKIVDYFWAIFFGNQGDGLIRREKWIPADGLLERLSATHSLAIYTGRIQAEVGVTLKRFADSIDFAAIITSDEVANGKPAPDGLELIQKRFPAARLLYVGDTVDDARCARSAGVPFIGIAASDNPLHEELAALLRAEGALAVIEDVNQMEGVLPA